MERFKCKRPCGKCPFSRAVKPGGIGDDPNFPATAYIGQIFGPFLLPCHQEAGFNEEGRCNIWPDVPQCAGAAMFRSNLGIAEIMPDGLHHLPKNTELVFASPEEFLAHHMQITLTEAGKILEETPAEELLKIELRKQIKLIPVPKREN